MDRSFKRVLLFVFYPFSKTLFLAFDLIFRPPGAGDFVPLAPPASTSHVVTSRQ